MEREINGQDSNETEEEVKSVVTVGVGNVPKNLNVLELVLGKVNYNILLSALCSVKDTNLRNKGLAAFFAKNKTFCSVECQTDGDMLIENVYDDGVEDNLSYESGIADDGSGGDGEPGVPQECCPYQEPSSARVSSSSLPAPPSPCYSTHSVPLPDHPDHPDHPDPEHEVPEQKTIDFPSDNVIESSVTCDRDIDMSPGVEDSSTMDPPESEEGAPSMEVEAEKQVAREATPPEVTERSQGEDKRESSSHQAVASPLTSRTTSEGRKRKSSHYKKPSSSTKIIVKTMPPRKQVPPTPPESKEPSLGPEFSYDEIGLLEIHRAVLSQDSDALLFCGENLKRRGYSVDQKTKYEGYTPLQLALVRGCEGDMVRVLLWLGCDPRACDAHARPTLLIALTPSSRTHLHPGVRATVKRFITTMATQKPQIFEEMCQQTDEQGLTVLMHCAINSWADSMQLLLPHMPPHLVDLQLPSSGMTALHMAMMAYSTALDNNRITFNSCKCITLLQNSGASDQIADAEGVTPGSLSRTPLVRTSLSAKQEYDYRMSNYGSNYRKKKHVIVDEGTRFRPGVKRIKTSCPSKTKQPNRKTFELAPSNKIKDIRNISNKDSQRVSTQDSTNISTKKNSTPDSTNDSAQDTKKISTKNSRKVSSKDSRKNSTPDSRKVETFVELKKSGTPDNRNDSTDESKNDSDQNSKNIYTHDSRKISSQCSRDIYKYTAFPNIVRSITICHSNVKVRRSYKDLKDDKTLQPFVKLLMNKKLNQLALRLRAIQISPVSGPKNDQLVPSNHLNRRQLPVKGILIKRSSLNSPSGGVSPGGHKKTKVVFSNKSLFKNKNTNQEEPAPAINVDNSNVNPIELSPKKKWLSRNKKWAEKSKEVLLNHLKDKPKPNSLSRRRQRCSLGSIANDVEIIKQAVAMQDSYR